MTKEDEAKRFSILRSEPNITQEWTHSDRTQELTLKYCGKLCGSKLRVFRRGKEIGVAYYITETGIMMSNP